MHVSRHVKTQKMNLIANSQVTRFFNANVELASVYRRPERIDIVPWEGEKKEGIDIELKHHRNLFVTSKISLFDDLFPPFPPEAHYFTNYPDRRKDSAGEEKRRREKVSPPPPSFFFFFLFFPSSLLFLISFLFLSEEYLADCLWVSDMVRDAKWSHLQLPRRGCHSWRESVLFGDFLNITKKFECS
ncbi:hypothetical protein CEXT_600231 [Caerostris extrusa]|uniref:Uncharacterized protein n=1 Tax=Caerostris extrusa TaxID=172846 RepID=A0AAV4QM28_CAEEX|nr:hypothetical protein CEXT_600231 [Caerostris extrusa]